MKEKKMYLKLFRITSHIIDHPFFLLYKTFFPASPKSFRFLFTTISIVSELFYCLILSFILLQFFKIKKSMSVGFPMYVGMLRCGMDYILHWMSETDNNFFFSGGVFFWRVITVFYCKFYVPSYIHTNCVIIWNVWEATWKSWISFPFIFYIHFVCSTLSFSCAVKSWGFCRFILFPRLIY